MAFSNSKKVVNSTFRSCASLALVIASNAQVIAMESPQAVVRMSTSTPQNLIAQAFNPPNEGEPTHTVGGASRGSCSGVNLSQVSIQHTSSSFAAQLPNNARAKQVFFSLRDANNNTVYQGFTPVKNSQVSIAGNAFAGVDLQQNSYTWSMAVICGRALRPDSPVFRGSL